MVREESPQPSIDGSKYGFGSIYPEKGETFGATAKRLQRSVEKLSCLSELEDRRCPEYTEGLDVSFSMDDLGKLSEQTIARFHIPLSFKKKAYAQCREKSLSESFAAPKFDSPKLEPIIRPTFKKETTLLLLDSSNCVELTCEEKESLLPNPGDNFAQSKISLPFDDDDELVPQPAVPELSMPVDRRIAKVGFDRLKASARVPPKFPSKVPKVFPNIPSFCQEVKGIKPKTLPRKKNTLSMFTKRLFN